MPCIISANDMGCWVGVCVVATGWAVGLRCINALINPLPVGIPSDCLMNASRCSSGSALAISRMSVAVNPSGSDLNPEPDDWLGLPLTAAYSSSAYLFASRAAFFALVAAAFRRSVFAECVRIALASFSNLAVSLSSVCTSILEASLACLTDSVAISSEDGLPGFFAMLNYACGKVYKSFVASLRV